MTYVMCKIKENINIEPSMLQISTLVYTYFIHREKYKIPKLNAFIVDIERRDI